MRASVAVELERLVSIVRRVESVPILRVVRRVLVRLSEQLMNVLPPEAPRARKPRLQ